MAISLAALRITIGLRNNGEADHPDWTALPIIGSGGTNKEIDRRVRNQCPFGWIYDKESGHREEDATSPLGQQFGVLLCSQQFATEAIANLDTKYAPTQLTEAQLTTFWDTRAYNRVDDELVDSQLIQDANLQMSTIDMMLADPGLPDPSAARDTLVARRTTIALRLFNIIDPDNSTHGVNKNIQKKWADFKAKHAITFLEP